MQNKALEFVDGTSDVDGQTPEVLATVYATLEALAKDIDRTLHYIKAEVSQQMDADANAADWTIFAGVGRTARILRTTRVSMNTSIEGPLRVFAEYMEPEAFDGLLTKQAEPKPPPPRKFSMTKVKPFGRKGQRFVDAIEAAVISKVLETDIKITEAK
mgnify:CR=1 FL=1